MTESVLEPVAAGVNANVNATPARARLPALDIMRGLVMVLMAIDHASGAFNAGRVFGDSPLFYQPGSPLPAGQFFTRFITHLCAPTFVFLAGASAALSVESRLRAGEPASKVDRHLLARGLLIAALDPLWMTWGFTQGKPVLLQVLFAIGGSMCAMTLLRRLPSKAMVALGLFFCVASEALIGLAFMVLGSDKPPLALAVALTGGRFGGLIVGYPILPWLGIMLLGWAYGRRLGAAPPARPERGLVIAGLCSLAVFVLVRGLNGYGNLRLFREDHSLVQWLHVCKYPPALAYDTLELGLMALLLAGFFALTRKAGNLPGLALLRLLGQTAFFFYLLHVHLLEAVAWLFGWQSKLGIESAYIGGFAIVAVLYPACVYYLRYKRAHPNGWTRFV